MAAALEVELREEDRASVIGPLEKLERDLSPLREQLPFGAPLWNGPAE